MGHVSHRNASKPEGSPLVIGDYVTVGHSVILHGCRIGNECLIGMGSIVMDDAVIEDRVMLGAGSLVPPGKVLESGHLYIGRPRRAPARADRSGDRLPGSIRPTLRAGEEQLPDGQPPAPLPEAAASKRQGTPDNPGPAPTFSRRHRLPRIHHVRRHANATRPARPVRHPPMTQTEHALPSTAHLTGFLRSRGWMRCRKTWRWPWCCACSRPKGCAPLPPRWMRCRPKAQRCRAELCRAARPLPRHHRPRHCLFAGRDSTLAHRIVGRHYLPRGPACIAGCLCR